MQPRFSSKQEHRTELVAIEIRQHVNVQPLITIPFLVLPMFMFLPFATRTLVTVSVSWGVARFVSAIFFFEAPLQREHPSDQQQGSEYEKGLAFHPHAPRV